MGIYLFLEFTKTIFEVRLVRPSPAVRFPFATAYVRRLWVSAWKPFHHNDVIYDSDVGIYLTSATYTHSGYVTTIIYAQERGIVDLMSEATPWVLEMRT